MADLEVQQNREFMIPSGHENGWTVLFYRYFYSVPGNAAKIRCKLPSAMEF